MICTNVTLFPPEKDGKEHAMGKGDKRTRRGKIWRGTYGNRRRKEKKSKAEGSKPSKAPRS